ncbi:chain-length determining protein [Sphingomonas sp. Leaf33]|uniref:XrtA system polysaccharide chain length determinant n=1 Tax=Sphingomonas sp. Leaf33 TaxID=1736215 RepID=UPI0006FF5040|nr:XrtA system polysaccharide chain length determinant [Sphingomonas sp. Leaf33]KQN25927.1 chain-length determining protein [Sphingomonas sp. Leaf33]
MGSGLFDELRAALHAVWTRRWVALAVAWGICLAGWLVVSQIPNQYESRARVFVQLRNVLPTQNGATQAEQTKAVDRIRQTLTSAVNLQKVVRGTDMAQTVSSDRDIADRVAGLQKAIKITSTQDNLFEISVVIANAGASDAANAKLARQIVQKLIDIFVEDNLSSNRDETSQSLAFLDNQLAARQRQLQDAEAKRADFQTKFLGSLPGTGTLDDRMSQARTQLAQIDSDLAAAQSSLAAVNGQMAGTTPSIAGAAGAAGPARARLQAIQGQIAEGRGRGWTDNHPDMIALRTQLAIATAAARGEPTGAGDGGSPNPLYLSLKSMQADKAAQVAALTERRNQITRDLNTFDAKVAQSPGAAAQQAAIDRDYQVLKDQYNQLLADREQTSLRNQVQTQTDAVKFNVVDPPTSPRAPIAPNRPLFLTGVLILGLCGGIGAAWALSQLRTTFATASRLEKASGMPILGSIGETVSAAQVALRRRRLRLFAGGAGALAAAWALLLGLEFFQRGMIA